jgi:predicted glycoside hydrolase/deacetylase ChbG (UPF0249 family)
MAPTPWFAEGALLAKKHGIATGLHVDFTCEWQYLRWAPLTAAPSLRDPDGGFVRGVAAAKQGSSEDAIIEVDAQIDRAQSLGLTLSYVDPHQGVSLLPAYEHACHRLGLKFMYQNVNPHLEWASIIVLSVGGPLADRTAWFVDQLEQLAPGTHMVMTHPGVACEELRSLTPSDAFDYEWTEPIREADLAALCAPEVRKVVENRKIELTTVAALTRGG